MIDLKTIKLVGGSPKSQSVLMPLEVAKDQKPNPLAEQQKKISTLNKIIADIKSGDYKKQEMIIDFKNFLKKSYIDTKQDEDCI